MGSSSLQKVMPCRIKSLEARWGSDCSVSEDDFFRASKAACTDESDWFKAQIDQWKSDGEIVEAFTWLKKARLRTAAGNTNLTQCIIPKSMTTIIGRFPKDFRKCQRKCSCGVKIIYNVLSKDQKYNFYHFPIGNPLHELLDYWYSGYSHISIIGTVFWSCRSLSEPE